MLMAMSIVLGLGACGGPDPAGLPGASTPSATASRDAGGFTPEQRDVIAAVKAYSAAIVSYQEGARKEVLDKVATPAAVDLMVGLIKPDKTRVLIGHYSHDTESVVVTGNRARYRGCTDFTGTTFVKKGKTAGGVGATAGTATLVDYSLVRKADIWLVDDPKSTGETC